jgi:hypothetical protein
MRRAGLQEVAAVAVSGRPDRVNLTGLLPGSGEGEILLTAHYDTVPGSPGAADDASGCGTVLAAAADLARTPLARSVRVVLFDGEEDDLSGSRAWVEGLSGEERRRVLAALAVEMVGWGGSCGPTLLALPARREDGRVLPPGWLVHAALRGGEAVGFPFAFLDRRGSLPAQLLLRLAEPAHGGDATALLAAGIPALTLTEVCPSHPDPRYHRAEDGPGRLEASALARWTEATAAVVRRLDHLEGRPIPEDSYLVLAGRVWLRRDFYWIGFALWAALVVQGYRRRTAGRARPGGFLFRLLFLAAVLVVPALALPLLMPAGLLTLFPPPTFRRRLLWAALGLAPAAALAGGLAVAAWHDLTLGWALGWLPAALLAATLAAWLAMTLAPAAPLSSH